MRGSGQYPASRNYIEYASYLSFFPQLIAGPIVRYGQVIADFRNIGEARLAPNILPAIVFISAGIFEKAVLAEHFGRFTDQVFAASSVGLIDGWAGAVSFGMQIFFDFSGYSLIAVGLGKLFGIDLPMNFNRPYLSKSVQEFWRRWHITLSSWFRDYVYIPLGGNRSGAWRTGINLAITMSLAGLWHGAAWTFVMWGTLHGLYLVGERFAVEAFGARYQSLRFNGLLSIALVFGLVTIAWVFFRADTFSSAMTMLRGMAGLEGIKGDVVRWIDFWIAILMGIFAAAYWKWFPFPWEIEWSKLTPVQMRQASATSAVMFAAGFLAIPSAGAFIYFQF